MMNDYVFKTKGRLPFFLSAPVFRSAELADYTEEDVEKDASMLMVLLLNAFHPDVGVKLQQIMLQAGELAAKGEEIGRRADAEDANLTEAMKHKANVAKFFDRIQTMAAERLMSLPDEDKPPIT